MADSDTLDSGLKCLVFDGARIEAALRLRFPMMDAEAIREIVVVASHVGDALWHAREARIAQRGQQWRPFDAFAEAIAAVFTLESMSQADATTGMTINLIHSAIHQVYAHPNELQGTPSLPPAMTPPGRGGFEN